jgi:hypothetical protein
VLLTNDGDSQNPSLVYKLSFELDEILIRQEGICVAARELVRTSDEVLHL